MRPHKLSMISTILGSMMIKSEESNQGLKVALPAQDCAMFSEHKACRPRPVMLIHKRDINEFCISDLLTENFLHRLK